jgi:predicted O-methyltransferase YrrM
MRSMHLSGLVRKAAHAAAGIRAAARGRLLGERRGEETATAEQVRAMLPFHPSRVGAVATPHGPVAVVPPRGEVEPGSGRYPPVVPGPRVPRHRRPVPRGALQNPPRHAAAEHPRRWEFPPYLANPSCRWLGVLKDLYGHPLSFPSSLSPEAGLLLHALVRNIRPRVVVETGSFIGISTIWIGAALAENGDGGIVHAFDDFGPIEKGPWRDAEMRTGRLEFVAGNIARAGLGDRVVLHPGNSAFEVRAFHGELAASGGVQMAFLDADHGVVGVWQDFWATEAVLNTGGYVVVHDTFPELCSYDGPRHLLDHLEQRAAGLYEKVDLYLAPMNYGMGLIRRIG